MNILVVKKNGNDTDIMFDPDTFQPFAWGILLVDLARHISNAYSLQGHDYNDILNEILSGFNAELENPTDIVEGFNLEFDEPT